MSPNVDLFAWFSRLPPNDSTFDAIAYPRAHPIASRRRRTRAMSSCEGIALVTRVIATPTSVALIGRSFCITSSLVMAVISSLEARRRELVTQPERFIAQEVVDLTTHPTFDGDGLYPHHVDLRAFVHLRPGASGSLSAHVMPAALTRVASRGSRIVNSSSGGGSKDTWLLAAPKTGERQ